VKPAWLAGALAVTIGCAAVALADGEDGGLGNAGATTPTSVPAGAVVAAGSSAISKPAAERTTKARVTGVSPLNGRATPPLVPLDPPSFDACAAAVKAQAKKAARKAPKGQKVPIPTADQLLATCKLQYKTTVDSALSTLIQQRWSIDQAAAEGVPVPGDAVDSTLKQYRAAAGLRSDGRALPPDQAAARFTSLLKRSGLTEGDLRFQLRAQLAQQNLIQERLEALGPAVAKDPGQVSRVQVKLQNELLATWRPRTLCAKDRLVPQCANGPKAQPLPVP
jgi:hypothetical protein